MIIIEEAIIKLLSAIATGQAIVIVKEALAALKQLQETDRGFVIWDRSTRSTVGANFQLGTATLSGNSIAMSSTNIYFSASKTDTRFLWFSYSDSDISLYQNTQAYTLDEDVYSQVRSAVVEKLGSKAIEFVHNLEV